ncbi:helix-turn-helix domain-containing protein [Parabacteroides sp. PF5-9]|uniref:AraC family transcriptional regulator n=1 Tax=Parabacteroides sp. PF5-9 TaxID=1742404 RepID=UPI0024750A4E|nr:helix-turn-helix domain-containing protein [Parabacteroides sp. PF5-9]MDH6357889.1 AraC-like DNA-binding protein [Parabacteroides sp. PF5-9]
MDYICMQTIAIEIHLNMTRIKHGFLGQRLVVLPFNIIEKALNNPLTSELVIHSMGYFPKAENHYIDRENGCGEYLLIYCTKGEGWYRLNGKLYIVPANHFFILPAEQAHQYGSSQQAPWSIYWIHFKGQKARYICDMLPGVRLIDMGESSRINDRISFFEELISALELGNDEHMINYANLSLNHLLGTFLYVQSYRDVKLRKKGTQNTFFISLATHYMNENIEKKITLKEIASYFGYSESHFYRLFFKEVKYSPMNYFLHLKIERACQFLIHTDMKINQISFKLGFEDQYYFSRIFTKIVGVSPRKYREEKRNG